MKITKELRNDRGITMVSLIITIVIMFIVSSTTVYTSVERFEANKYNKMKNDIELLNDKVANYYLQYNGLPISKDSENNIIKYTYYALEFEKNANDNENYYIIDLEAIGDILLNYGKKGFKNPKTSKDVYIINETSHQIYYVEGIKMDGDMYYTINNEDETMEDKIPPSKPELKIVSGNLNDKGIYTTEVKMEVVEGKDNWSGTKETVCSISKDGVLMSNEEVEKLKQNNLYTLSENGKYIIILKTYDNNNNVSEKTYDLEVVTKLTVATLKGKNILSETDNTIVNDMENKTLIVPAGFTIASDSADTVKEGVVITDALTAGNQFVWIPVDDINTMVMCKSKTENDQCNIQLNSDETALICKTHNDSTDICGKLYATTFGNNFNSSLTTQEHTSTTLFREPDNLLSTTDGDASSEGLELLTTIVGLEGDITTTDGANELLDKWDEMLENGYKEMALEVAKKGGFYVGRYETSVDDNGNVQSKKNAIVSSAESEATRSWYGLYKKQKEFSTITMKSSMIWGSQYDAMMLWMSANNITITSTTPTVNASKNTSKTNTGENDNDQLNKVYDLLGGKREWTLEASSSGARIYRGGYFGANSSPSNRGSISPYQEDAFYGSRMVLY